MSRMSEYAAEQDQRDNESGLDMCEAWHEYNCRILGEFSKVTEGMVAEGKRHTELMEWMNGVNEGFDKIFKGERNERL